MDRTQWMVTTEPKQSSSRAGVCRMVIGAAALSLSWSAIALGASNMGADCEHSGAEFLKASVDSDELAISVVDLTDDKDQVVITASPDETSVYGESAAPLLFLTPRAESIVDDVFRADDGELQEPGVQDSGAKMTPLAESVDESVAAPAVESIDSNPALDLRPLLPSIQRQMYRTDI